MAWRALARPSAPRSAERGGFFIASGSNPLNHRDDVSGPALRHGSLNCFFQVAVYLHSSYSSSQVFNSNEKGLVNGFLVLINSAVGATRCTHPETYLIQMKIGIVQAYVTHEKHPTRRTLQ